MIEYSWKKLGRRFTKSGRPELFIEVAKDIQAYSREPLATGNALPGRLRGSFSVLWANGLNLGLAVERLTALFKNNTPSKEEVDRVRLYLHILESWTTVAHDRKEFVEDWNEYADGMLKMRASISMYNRPVC